MSALDYDPLECVLCGCVLACDGQCAPPEPVGLVPTAEPEEGK